MEEKQSKRGVFLSVQLTTDKDGANRKKDTNQLQICSQFYGPFHVAVSYWGLYSHSG